jgi:hypothetical protein
MTSIAWFNRVVELGGQDTGERHEYPEGVVVVLTDPEGNELCIVHYEQFSRPVDRCRTDPAVISV